MFRVIYQWTVDPKDREAFVRQWRIVTTTIHETMPGALGSFCLNSVDDPEVVLTIALWDSETQWRDFIKTAKSGSMRRLHEMATQVSATPYHQLGDETVLPEEP